MFGPIIKMSDSCYICKYDWIENESIHNIIKNNHIYCFEILFDIDVEEYPSCICAMDRADSFYDHLIDIIDTCVSFNALKLLKHVCNYDYSSSPISKFDFEFDLKFLSSTLIRNRLEILRFMKRYCKDKDMLNVIDYILL